MNWTKELPTQAGFYWHRTNSLSTSKVVEIVDEYMLSTGSFAHVNTGGVKGEFLGPLRPEQLLNLGRV